jgi:predicted mannosyl-3-phosphoglycerate phosphatase (HAD superfamily)
MINDDTLYQKATEVRALFSVGDGKTDVTLLMTVCAALLVNSAMSHNKDNAEDAFQMIGTAIQYMMEMATRDGMKLH